MHDWFLLYRRDKAQRIDWIIKKKNLFSTIFRASFQLYCLFTQSADHRGPQLREKKGKQWSFPLHWNSQATLCLCVCFSLSLSSPLPFPPPPSAVTEQTGQVINSGATTLNLSCRQGCFCLSLWCAPFRRAPATLGFFWQTKHRENCDENLPAFFFFLVPPQSLDSRSYSETFPELLLM